MSGKLGIIIQARMSSSRLPGKSLLPIGDYPLIWYVVQRAKATDLPVVVATSTDPSDDLLCDFLASAEIPFYRGALYDVLDRYIKTSQKFEIENIIRVTADNPLFDFEYLQQKIDLFDRYSYADGIYTRGFIHGAGFELVKLSELESIPSSKKEHREHVTLYLREHLRNSEKRTQILPNEINLFREDIILTCDYQSDFNLLNEIFRHFNYTPNILLSDLVPFLDRNPHIKNLNKNRDNGEVHPR